MFGYEMIFEVYGFVFVIYLFEGVVVIVVIEELVLWSVMVVEEYEFCMVCFGCVWEVFE